MARSDQPIQQSLGSTSAIELLSRIIRNFRDEPMKKANAAFERLLPTKQLHGHTHNTSKLFGRASKRDE